MTRNKLSILLIALLVGSVAAPAQAAEPSKPSSLESAWAMVCQGARRLIASAAPAMPDPRDPNRLAGEAWTACPLPPPLKAMVMQYLPIEPRLPTNHQVEDLFREGLSPIPTIFASIDSVNWHPMRPEVLNITAYCKRGTSYCFYRFIAAAMNLNPQQFDSHSMCEINPPKKTTQKMQCSKDDGERATVEITNKGKCLTTTFDYPAHAALRAALLPPKALGAAAAAARPL